MHVGVSGWVQSWCMESIDLIMHLTVFIIIHMEQGSVYVCFNMFALLQQIIRYKDKLWLGFKLHIKEEFLEDNVELS